MPNDSRTILIGYRTRAKEFKILSVVKNDSGAIADFYLDLLVETQITMLKHIINWEKIEKIESSNSSQPSVKIELDDESENMFKTTPSV